MVQRPFHAEIKFPMSSLVTGKLQDLCHNSLSLTLTLLHDTSRQVCLQVHGLGFLSTPSVIVIAWVMWTPSWSPRTCATFPSEVCLV